MMHELSKHFEDVATVARNTGYQMALTDAVTIIAGHTGLSAIEQMALATEIGALNIETRAKPTRRDVLKREFEESIEGRAEPSPELAAMREAAGAA